MLTNLTHHLLGSPALAGSALVKDNLLSLSVGGTDIWGGADEGRLSCLPQRGDFSFTARFCAMNKSHLYAKAGLMFRPTLYAQSSFVYLFLFPDNAPRNNNQGGVELAIRQSPGANAYAIYPTTNQLPLDAFPVSYPNGWTRLVRTGNRFQGLVSTDGQQWREYASVILDLPLEGYLGVAVTSHQANTEVTVAVSDIAHQ